MGGRVDYIVKSGPVPKGIASTVVDITSEAPKLLREGAIPFSLVLATWGSASEPFYQRWRLECPSIRYPSS